MFSSSVLIFDNRVSKKNTLGADVCDSYDKTLSAINEHNFQSVTMNQKLMTTSQATELIEAIKSKNSDTEIIFITDPALNFTQAQEVQQISNRFPIFKIISNFDEQFLFRTIQESLEAFNLKQQNNELLNILSEQNEKLQVITKDLEDRIVIRQKRLLESKEKLLQTNKYYGSILVALVAIQKAESVTEMERTLLKSLSEPLHISWVRILFQSQTSAASNSSQLSQNISVFEHDLILENRPLGKIIFAKESNEKFTKEETQFLRQVSNAISLAMDRLIHREQSDFLRKQWQATFDAITEPVVLVRDNFEIVQYNDTFKSHFPNQLKELKHSITLGKTSSLRSNHPVTNQEILYEVDSQKMKSEGGEKIYINIYRNKTKQKKAERQILESSKIAELGLIGGSIAHELNNPLAGLITFIQMLKLDVKKDKNAELLNDLEEMEKSALRCKEIIQNLLSFSRKSDTKKEQLHLKDIINKAIRIILIKAKPLGIDVTYNSRSEEDIVEGHENPLTQSVINILQNSVDAISEKQKADKSFNPKIEIVLSNDSSNFYLDVLDNGIGLGKNDQIKIFTPFFSTKNPEQHRGLGLTTAYQIIQEHSGDIELTDVFENNTRTRVTLPRPVLKS